MTAWPVWDLSPGAWPVAVGVALAAAVAGRQYARAAAAWPAAFRAAALGLLVLTALRPAVRYIEPPGTGRPLRVVIDDSRSMATIDTTRSPGERLRLAAALGQYDGVAASPVRDVARLRAALGELRQANDAFAGARQAGPNATVELAGVATARDAADAAAKALIDSAKAVGCGDATLDTLRQIERAIVDGGQPGFIGRAADDALAELRRRARDADDRAAVTDAAAADAVIEVQDLSRFELALAAVKRIRLANGAAPTAAGGLDGQPIDLANGAWPAAAASTLTAALRDACVRAAAEKAEAVVLVSDGRGTEAKSLLAAAAAAATNVPVYTVAVAPEQRSPDARVVRVDAPPSVLAGQDVAVRVRVAQRDAAGRSARLVLSDGKTDIARTVTLGGEGVFSFTWPAARPPRLTLRARIEGLEEETRRQNNSGSTDVAVEARRQRVLLLTGPTGRDTAELAAALIDAPWAVVDHRILTDDRVESIDGAAFETADLIVLADVPRSALSAAAWGELVRAVRTRGKSLVVLAGQGEWLADSSNARRLAPLLPATSGQRPQWVTPPQQVWPVPTGPGNDTPYLRPDDSVDGGPRAWLDRPKLSRVLTIGPLPWRARQLLIDRTTRTPLIVESGAGGGRVVMVLTDDIWRWSTADVPDAAKRFWLSLAAAVVDAPYGMSGDGLSLAVDRADAPAGRGINVRLRAADPAGGSVTLAITRQGVAVAAPPLRNALPGGGRWTTVFDPPPGEYELIVRQGTRLVRERVAVHVDADVETGDTAPDAAFLRRIADATGGAAVAIDELDRLSELLAQRRSRDVRVATYELWCSPYWFGAIVACLGLEWSCRPRAGLP